MNKNPRIIVIDSGIGGVTVLAKLLPYDVRLTYIADREYFPYGNQSHSWITTRLIRLVTWALDLEPDCIIIACNSATVSAISKTRQLTKVPLIGVEPVIKPLAEYSCSLLLATGTTLKSLSTKKLLKKYNPPNIILHSPPGLAKFIEEMDAKNIKKSLRQIKKITGNLDIQAIGLSCTHYPLIKNDFHLAFPNAKIIDPSNAILTRLLSLCPLELATSNPSSVDWYTTSEVVKLKQLLKHYLGLDTSPQSLQL